MKPTPNDSHNWPIDALVTDMAARHGAAVGAVQSAAGALELAIKQAVPRLQAGGRFIYSGAGTSGRLAAQDAAELPPTFNWPRERALVLIAGGLDALHTPVERAEDDSGAGRDDMADLNPGAHDVAIGVAASGTTPYTIGSLRAARARGALTIAICNRPDSPITQAADISVVLATGPEFVHGSTRLAAGTAQKVALNILSTGVMVRLGRVYCGHMVEMPPTNAKLESRAIDIVADVAGCDKETARTALARADNNVKLAIVMAACGVARDRAEERLEQANGLLREVI